MTSRDSAAVGAGMGKTYQLSQMWARRLVLLTGLSCLTLAAICVVYSYTPQPTLVVGISLSLAPPGTLSPSARPAVETDEAEESAFLLEYYKSKRTHPRSDKMTSGSRVRLRVDPNQSDVTSFEEKSEEKSSKREEIPRVPGIPKQSQTHESVLDDADIRKVVLLTYFRGGSTFLGDAFNQNENAFYWFEPLAAPLFEYKRTFQTKDYEVDKHETAVPRPIELTENLVTILQQILDCDVESLSAPVMKHYFATTWRKSVKFYRYQACIYKYRIRHGGNVTDSAVAKCRKYVAKPCQRSKLRVVKSIRLFVEEAIPLIHMDPEVQLVYYVRDPRGILLSRWSLVKVSPADVPLSRVNQAAAYLCAKMRADIVVAKRLRNTNPDKIMLLRYEDLAIHPIQTVAAVYKFIETDLPPDVVSWIEYATHAQRSDGTIGTKRENATAVAARWQSDLPVSVMAIIDSHCSDVITAIYSTDFDVEWMERSL